MISLVEVATGWFNMVNSTPDIKELAKRRLAICDICPSKIQLSTAGQLLITTLNSEASTYLCEECGCPLAAKVCNKHSKCPLNKWNNLENFY